MPNDCFWEKDLPNVRLLDVSIYTVRNRIFRVECQNERTNDPFIHDFHVRSVYIRILMLLCQFLPGRPDIMKDTGRMLAATNHKRQTGTSPAETQCVKQWRCGTPRGVIHRWDKLCRTARCASQALKIGNGCIKTLCVYSSCSPLA